MQTLLFRGGAGIALLAVAFVAHASGVVVTPLNPMGWTTADTRPGGAVTFVVDSGAPEGVGALQMTTDATNAAKAQYLRSASTAITDVTELSYSAKQTSASFAGGNASYQLPVFLQGTSGFTTLVFEPYQNGVVTPNTWQSWDVDSGMFWSSRTVSCSNGGVVAGAGGAPFYTLAQIQTMCPEAMVLGFGVNIGTFNPSYTVSVDLVSFNGEAFDFEPYVVAVTMDQCKNGGWKNVVDINGAPFKNQGQCVASTVPPLKGDGGGPMPN